MIKIIKEIQYRFKRLLTTPGEELGRWANLARTQTQLWIYCFTRLRKNNAMAMSAALSFRTIFTLVPLLLLSFLFLKSVGKVEQSKELLHDFFDQAGLTKISLNQSSPQQEPIIDCENPLPSDSIIADPAEADLVIADPEDSVTVADQIETMLDDAESQITIDKLGPIGVILLVWTALTLLTTIERSLNRIFEAPKSRSVIRRILIYWSVVTLGPIVMLAVSYAVSQARDNVQDVAVLSWMLSIFNWVGPGLVGIALLAILYTTMPNTRVSFRSALQAAVVTVPLWLVGRWAFGLYVLQVSGNSIYGALALLPLFLFWMNISWWVFLFGAELAHSMMHVSQMGEPDNRTIGPWDYLAAVVSVTKCNLSQEKPVATSDVSANLALTDTTTEKLLSCLTTAGVLARVEAGDNKIAYLPAMPASKLFVKQILKIGSPVSTDDRDTNEITKLRQKTESAIENLTVEDILNKQ